MTTNAQRADAARPSPAGLLALRETLEARRAGAARSGPPLDLAGANLFEADLTGAELTGADLSDARLDGARLAGAGLGRADLSAASLTCADLADATLTDARLTDADLRSATLDGARARDADLRGADLSGTSLRGADLGGAAVDRALLDRADLRGAALAGLRGYRLASWIGADLREVDFTGAHLCRKFVLDQNFIEEFRTRSRWSRVVYELWYLTSDCGRSATRWSVCTALLVLAFAWAYTLVGIDYGAYETPLSPLYYSVVTLTTLGYGDAVPSTAAGQAVAMLQVLTGYVMLGGLLSILSSKLASRAGA